MALFGSQRFHQIRHIVVKFGTPIFTFSVILHVFLSCCYTIRPTIGISMTPTLNAMGDCLLISRKNRRGRDVDVGDVVTFYHPIVVDEGAVKRIIGMPGDMVLKDTPGKGKGYMLQVRTGVNLFICAGFFFLSYLDI